MRCEEKDVLRQHEKDLVALVLANVLSSLVTEATVEPRAAAVSVCSAKTSRAMSLAGKPRSTASAGTSGDSAWPRREETLRHKELS